MKKHLFVAVSLSMLLFSCAPRVVYVDRPVQPANASTPQPSNDNQVYQAPAAAYTPAPAPVPATTTQYNNNTQPNNTVVQNNNGGQQDYYNNQNNNNQSYTQESDQQYYANQQQVNYGSSSYQTFYDELAPYGSWVNYQSYGYVWVPNQGPGFTPYSTNGYWVYTQYGMTWVSNYNWGWAPFHYGNWTLDPFYGWLWIPGHTWAPAWVTWGHCNGYYGWAPIGPGVTYYDGYRPPQNHWCFVEERRLTEHNVHNYVVTHDNNYLVYNSNVTNVTIVNHNETYNNTVYNAGPHKSEVETVTGHPVQVVNISETAKPVPANQVNNNNNLSIYRPVIAKANNTNTAPKNVVPITYIKPATPTPIHNLTTPANNNVTPVHPNQVNPATKPVEPSPTINHNRVQSQPTQEKPVPVQPAVIERKPEPVPPTIERKPEPIQHNQPPVIERKPEPIQRNPNPTPNQNTNQNRQVTPKPQPQPRPQPKPQPKPVTPRNVPEKGH